MRLQLLLRLLRRLLRLLVLQGMQRQQHLHFSTVQQRVPLQQLQLAPGQRLPLGVAGAARLHIPYKKMTARAEVN